MASKFNTTWFELAGGYSVGVALQRKRHGLSRPPRFIVLMPPRGRCIRARELGLGTDFSERFRKTLCAGDYDYIGDDVTIDLGVCSESMRAELRSVLSKWTNEDAVLRAM